MNRRRRRPVSLHPYRAWTDLALQTAEMLAASAQVIAHRTSRPASAAELYGMGSEKVEAAMRSSHAMMRNMVAMQTSTPGDFWLACAKLLASGLAPVHARAVSNAKRYSRR